jgi:hemoglobin-like flavoprotein
VQSESGATPFFELIRLTVKKIDDFESLVPILQSAGKYQRKFVPFFFLETSMYCSHLQLWVLFRIGVRTKHFDSVGGSFLYSIEQTLGKSGDLAWTKPVKEAWTWIFVFIAKVMQPGDDDETRKKATVRRTWTLFEKSNSQAQFADLMFKTLFDVDSNIAALFKSMRLFACVFFQSDTYLCDLCFPESDMAAHQSKFISTITLILSLLDDKDRLVQTLTQLGKAHSGLGLELTHYKTFGDVLLRCLMMTLGAEFNNEVRDAWTWLYSIMAKLMLSDSANASKKKQSIENAAAAAKAAAPAAVSPVASPAKTESPKEAALPAQSPVKAAPAAEPQPLNSAPQVASPKKVAPVEAASAKSSIAPASPVKVAPSETKADIKPVSSPAAVVEPVSSPVKSISAAPVAVQSVQSVPLPEVIAPAPEPVVVQVPLENANVVPTVSPTAAAPTLREPEVDPATLPPADQATEVHRTWGVFQSLLPSVQATLFSNTLRMLNRTAPATASLFDGTVNSVFTPC